MSAIQNSAASDGVIDRPVPAVMRRWPRLAARKGDFRNRALRRLGAQPTLIALACLLMATNTVIGIFVADGLKRSFAEIARAQAVSAVVERLRGTVDDLADNRRDSC